MPSFLDRFRHRSSNRAAVELRPRITIPFDPNRYRPALALIRIPDDPSTTAMQPAPGDDFGTGFFVTANGVLLTAAHNLTHKKRVWDDHTRGYIWVPDPHSTPLKWVWVCCYETGTRDWTDARQVTVEAALINADLDAAALRVARVSDPLAVADDCRRDDSVVVLGFQPEPLRASGYNARSLRCAIVPTHAAAPLEIDGVQEPCLRLGFDRDQWPMGEGMSGGPVLNVECDGCPGIAIEKWVLPGEGLRLPEVETTAIQWLRTFLDRLPEARDITWLPRRDSPWWFGESRFRRRAIGLLILGAFLSVVVWVAVQKPPPTTRVSIDLDEIPPYDPVGGSDRFAPIGGVVSGAGSSYQVVIYACTRDQCWVQPFTTSPFTKIGADGKWHNRIHLGESYAVLVVDQNFTPPATLANPYADLPGVVSSKVVEGTR